MAGWWCFLPVILIVHLALLTPLVLLRYVSIRPTGCWQAVKLQLSEVTLRGHRGTNWSTACSVNWAACPQQELHLVIECDDQEQSLLNAAATALFQ
jgi:hypothetical protein